MVYVYLQHVPRIRYDFFVVKPGRVVELLATPEFLGQWVRLNSYPEKRCLRGQAGRKVIMEDSEVALSSSQLTAPLQGIKILFG